MPKLPVQILKRRLLLPEVFNRIAVLLRFVERDVVRAFDPKLLYCLLIPLYFLAKDLLVVMEGVLRLHEYGFEPEVLIA
jgi:hypothetical protein